MAEQTTQTTPETEAVIAELQARVRTAKAIRSIPDLSLLDDAEVNPELLGLRSRLSRTRQVDRLRRRHRAELRAQRRAEFDQRLDEQGHRLVRRRALADSPERAAASLDRLRRWTVALGAAGIAGMGAASTAGVHAGLVALVGPEVATAAWGYEPSVITLVAGGIVARSVLERSGGRMPTAVTVLEWVALGTSVVLAVVGGGVGAALFPVGVAAIALVMQQILGAIGRADVHRPARRAARRLEEERQERGAAPARTAAPTAPEGPEEAVLRDGLAAAEDYANGRASGERSHGPSERSDDGGDPPEDADPEPPGGADGQVATCERPSERDRSHGAEPDAGEASERVLSAQERRRLEGEANRRSVAAYLSDHPGAQTADVARALDLGESTVRRIRRELEGGAS